MKNNEEISTVPHVWPHYSKHIQYNFSFNLTSLTPLIEIFKIFVLNRMCFIFD